MVYAEDVNIKKMFSIRGYSAKHAEIINDPDGYWKRKPKGYKFEVKSLMDDYLKYKNGKIDMRFVCAFHRKRDALNYISDYNKNQFGTGGVVIDKEESEVISIRTYYNGGNTIRIFYMITMDVEDGFLKEETKYKVW